MTPKRGQHYRKSTKRTAVRKMLKKKPLQMLSKSFLSSEIARAMKIFKHLDRLAHANPDSVRIEYIEDQAKAIENGLRIFLEHGQCSKRDVSLMKELIHHAENYNFLPFLPFSSNSIMAQSTSSTQSSTKTALEMLPKSFLASEIDRAKKILAHLDALVKADPDSRGIDYIEDQAEAIKKDMKIFQEHAELTKPQVALIDKIVDHAENYND